MFKRIALFSLVMVLACASAFASAPDRINKVDWGVEIGGALPDGSMDSAIYYQTNLSYGLTEWIAIGIEGGWWEANTDAANNESIGLGQILGDIIVRIPTLHDQIVPYGILGLGYAGVYMENSPSTNAQQGKDSSDNTFAYKIGGGIDWFTSDQWILNFELAYNGNSPDLPTASTEKTDFTSITIGAKYIF